MALDKPKRNRELPQMGKVQEIVKEQNKLREAMEKAKQLGDDTIRQRVETEVQKKQQEKQKQLEQMQQQLTQALQAWEREEQQLGETKKKAQEAGAEINVSDKEAEIKREIEQIQEKLRELQRGLSR